MSVLKFLPDVKKDVKKRMQDYSVNDVIAEEFDLKPEEMKFINYNAEAERFTLNQDGTRFVLQNISNYGLRDMERVVSILGKERFDCVMLSLTPLNNERNDILVTTEDVENEI